MQKPKKHDTQPLEPLMNRGTDALGAWISKELADAAAHAVGVAEDALGLAKSPAKSPAEPAQAPAPSTPKTKTPNERRMSFAKRWASGALIFATIAIPVSFAWKTEQSLPKAPPQGHQPIYLLGQTEEDAVRRDTDEGGAFEKRQAIETQLSQCVASGDCVRTTGVGSEAAASIDLSLLGKGVECQNVCSVEGVHRDQQDPSKTLPVYLETKTRGEVVAWSEFEVKKVGYRYKPALSGQKIFWSREEFNR